MLGKNKKLHTFEHNQSNKILAYANSRKKPRFYRFNGVLCEARAYTVTGFFLQQLYMNQVESGTRKAIYWSVFVYNKTLSSQCKLTAQIESVYDKKN